MLLLSHFVDWETKAQRDYLTCPGHVPGKKDGWGKCADENKTHTGKQLHSVIGKANEVIQVKTSEERPIRREPSTNASCCLLLLS